MSTSEYRSVDAESDLPISAAELAALASQLFAASVRPGPDSPPQTRAVGAARQRARRDGGDVGGDRRGGAGESGDAAAPVRRGARACYVPAPTSPGPEGIPPQTVPVAPRGNVPDVTAAPSAGTPPRECDPSAPGRDCRVRGTSGIVPTDPGRAGRRRRPRVPVAPRGSAPGWPAWRAVGRRPGLAPDAAACGARG